MRPKLSFANVVSVLALFVALGGSAYAFHLGKNSVGSKQLKKNAVVTAKVKNEAITAAKIKKGTLTGAQINASTLGTVPTAQTAQTANSLAPSEGWHEVGTPGEPAFQHNWTNFGDGDNVAFYRDHDGIVHLKGHAAGGASNNAIFQLPAGFRPASGTILPFTVECNCSVGDPQGGQVELMMGLVHVAGSFNQSTFDGGVFLYTAGSSVNFSGISFRAES